LLLLSKSEPFEPTMRGRTPKSTGGRAFSCDGEKRLELLLHGERTLLRASDRGAGRLGSLRLVGGGCLRRLLGDDGVLELAGRGGCAAAAGVGVGVDAAGAAVGFFSAIVSMPFGVVVGNPPGDIASEERILRPTR
jgi:hypothetical protein